MVIVGNDEKPEVFARVVYFEAFNISRDCLRMDGTEIPVRKMMVEGNPAYGLPQSMARLTTTYSISPLQESMMIWKSKFDKGIEEQFDKFLDMDASWLKILSFGGWAESTDPETFQRYNDAVKKENCKKFSDNVASSLRTRAFAG
jgi:chitinase